MESLLSFALGLPGTREDHPWGETVAKVGAKVFVFFGSTQPASMSVKLPDSAEQALLLPDAAPTGYGLGRAGWVSVPIGSGGPPIGVLRDWIEESYRAVAPKRLIAELDGAR